MVGSADGWTYSSYTVLLAVGFSTVLYHFGSGRSRDHARSDDPKICVVVSCGPRKASTKGLHIRVESRATEKIIHGRLMMVDGWL